MACALKSLSQDVLNLFLVGYILFTEIDVGEVLSGYSLIMKIRETLNSKSVEMRLSGKKENCIDIGGHVVSTNI